MRDFSYSNNYTLEQYIKAAFLCICNDNGIVYSEEKIDFFKKKKWLILLDGLDEIKSEAYDKIQEEILSFKSAYGQTTIILSTRIDGFKTKREANFTAACFLTIAPLNIDIVKDYINKWFSNKQKAAEFIDIILENSRLLELSQKSIFILRLACMVYEKGREISSNLSQIYRDAIDYLLETRTPKGSSMYDTKHKILKNIAFRFLQMQEKIFDKYITEAIVQNTISQKSYTEQFPEAILLNIIKETNLLQQIRDNYEFTHLTFQEYLTAQALIDEGVASEKLLEYCNVNSWEEVFKFYVELLSDERKEYFIKEISKRNLSLALRVCAVCGNMSNVLMKDVICNSHKNNKLRMLDELETSLATLNEETKIRIILDTIEFLFKHELDSSVLYCAIELLKRYDSNDERKIMYNNFYAKQNEKLQELISNEKYKFELLDIGNGEFMMGNNNSIEQNEKPEHKVKINQFKISKYPLTNSAYEFIMNLDKSRRNKYSNLDTQPAINVDWYDAYICAIRIGCRLPSEAEWEYATRANTTTKWWFGNDESLISTYACCYETDAKETREVEKGVANPWGLVDVHGNVWEWCNDWFSDYSQETQANPQGAKEGTIRVRRGGGWRYHARGCQSSFRYGNEPYYKYDDIGIRLAQ